MAVLHIDILYISGLDGLGGSRATETADEWLKAFVVKGATNPLPLAISERYRLRLVGYCEYSMIIGRNMTFDVKKRENSTCCIICEV